LLSTSRKIKIYRTVILPVVLHGCETWSLTQREEHRLSVFSNRILRKIFVPTGEEEQGKGGIYIMNSFMICAPYHILLE
jgi:hypothetical protein